MSDLDEARVVAAGMRAVIDQVSADRIIAGGNEVFGTISTAGSTLSDRMLWGIPALREINFDTPWQKLEKAIGNRHERRARKARAK